MQGSTNSLIIILTLSTQGHVCMYVCMFPTACLVETISHEHLSSMVCSRSLGLPQNLIQFNSKIKYAQIILRGQIGVDNVKSKGCMCVCVSRCVCISRPEFLNFYLFIFTGLETYTEFLNDKYNMYSP